MQIVARAASSLLAPIRMWQAAKLQPDTRDLYYALTAARDVSAAFSASVPSTRMSSVSSSERTKAEASSIANGLSSSLNWSSAASRSRERYVEDAAAGTIVRALIDPAANPCPLDVQPSRLNGAGMGTIARRHVRIGEMLAIYPGTIYGRGGGPAMHAGTYFDREDVSMLLKPPAGSCYVMTRPDGMLIDASEIASAASLDRLRAERTEWAVGHIANHPPQGTLPSAIEMPLSISITVGSAESQRHPDGQSQQQRTPSAAPSSPSQPPSLPLHLAHRLPYCWAPYPMWTSQAAASMRASTAEGGAPHGPLKTSSAASGSAIDSGTGEGLVAEVPMVVLLATRDIGAGEEVHLDYDFVDHDGAAAAAAAAFGSLCNGFSFDPFPSVSSHAVASASTSSSSSLPPWYHPVPRMHSWDTLSGACARAGIDLPIGSREAMQQLREVESRMATMAAEQGHGHPRLDRRQSSSDGSDSDHWPSGLAM